jgi:hypothetical protein
MVDEAGTLGTAALGQPLAARDPAVDRGFFSALSVPTFGPQSRAYTLIWDPFGIERPWHESGVL